jgi:hypothetical protein
LSGVEARVDGLEAVFAPQVFAELDLNGDAFRRLVAGGDCWFGGQSKAAGCKGFCAHIGLALPQSGRPLNPQSQRALPYRLAREIRFQA